MHDGPTSDVGGDGLSSTNGVTVKFVALAAASPIEVVMAMGRSAQYQARARRSNWWSGHASARLRRWW
jgi:hypothetical protein